MKYQFHVELTEADFAEYRIFMFTKSRQAKRRIQSLAIAIWGGCFAFPWLATQYDDALWPADGLAYAGVHAGTSSYGNLYACISQMAHEVCDVESGKVEWDTVSAVGSSDFL